MGSTGSKSEKIGSDLRRKDKDKKFTFKFDGINQATGKKVEGKEIKAASLAEANSKVRDLGYTLTGGGIVRETVYDQKHKKK